MEDRASRQATHPIGASLFGLAVLAALPGTAAATPGSDFLDLMTAFQEHALDLADIEEGEVGHVTHEECESFVEKYGTCFGLNPASPYITYRFDDFPGVDRPRYTLDANQAMVLLWHTPPESRYFSHQTYRFSVYRRGIPDPLALFDCDARFNFRIEGKFGFCDPSSSGSRVDIRRLNFGPIGNNLNHLELRTSPGPSAPFDSDVIIITTPNIAVEGIVRAGLLPALVEAGLPQGIVHHEPVPDSLLQLGHGRASDDFTSLMRMALTLSEAEREAYLADVPARVFRLTFDLPDPVLSDQLEYQLRPRPTPPPASSYNEDAYEAGLQQVIDEVAAHYGAPDEPVYVRPFRPAGNTYVNCTRSQDACMAPSEDAYYSLSPRFARRCLNPANARAVLAVGVNHSLVGPYSYFSLSMREPQTRHEVAFVPDLDTTIPIDPLAPRHFLEGSVDAVLPPGLDLSPYVPAPELGQAARENLFVFQFAEPGQCLGDDGGPLRHCIELDPVRGAAEDVELEFHERIYLNEAELTAPQEENFAKSRLVILGARSADCR